MGGSYDQRGFLDFSFRPNISEPITWHAEMHLVKAIGTEVTIFPEGIEWGWSIGDRCHCLPEPNLSLESSVNPSKVLQPTLLTATFFDGFGGSPDTTGYVTFVDNTATEARYIARVPIEKDANGVSFARANTLFLTAGDHTVTATFDGDASWLGVRASLVQTVNKQNAQLNMGSSANPVVFGQPVTFTAIVSAVEPGVPTPTGTVNFYDGSTFLGSGTLDANGQATFTTSALSAGDHAITAVYDGDEYFNGTTSDVLTQTIEPSGSNSATVGDFVWHDLNGNGLQDDLEPGVAGVLVQLIPVDGSYFADAHTDETGHYLFMDVPEGLYYLQFSLPEGYAFTQPHQGDPALDSDVLGGSTLEFPLGAGEVNPDLDAGLVATAAGQWASTATASSEWGAYPDYYSAFQVIGAPDVEAYGDSPFAWAAADADVGIQTLTVSFATPVHATGVTIRESYGNGFVVRIDLIDEFDQVHPDIWTGTDTSQPGSLADFVVPFPATPYLVKGVIIYVNTDHNLGGWEEIDAVMLHGDTGGGFAAMGAGGSGGLSRPRVSSVRRVNRGPSATLAVSGPVALGTAVDFLFRNPRDRSRSVTASAFRYSLDFNNDGDFTDPGEVQNSTSLSARHTFRRRGWHIIHGRVRSADGRFTDLWLRVFVP